MNGATSEEAGAAAVGGSLRWLLDTSDFPPRWHCGEWSAVHGWSHVAADLAIFSAYAALPVLLAWFVRRRPDVPFPRIFWLFVAFIFACGTTHLVDATLFWHPWYRLAAVLKIVTAVVSWATVAALVPVIPRALALPGLASVNARLEDEAAQREAALRDLEVERARLGRMVHALSHELRTPLVTIGGYAGFARQQLAQGELQALDESLARVETGVGQLRSLLDEVGER